MHNKLNRHNARGAGLQSHDLDGNGSNDEGSRYALTYTSMDLSPIRAQLPKLE